MMYPYSFSQTTLPSLTENITNFTTANTVLSQPNQFHSFQSSLSPIQLDELCRINNTVAADIEYVTNAINLPYSSHNSPTATLKAIKNLYKHNPELGFLIQQAFTVYKKAKDIVESLTLYCGMLPKNFIYPEFVQNLDIDIEICFSLSNFTKTLKIAIDDSSDNNEDNLSNQISLMSNLLNKHSKAESRKNRKKQTSKKKLVTKKKNKLSETSSQEDQSTLPASELLEKKLTSINKTPVQLQTSQGGNIYLADLTFEQGFHILGEIKSAQTGEFVTQLGDVNGDRIKDLFVGAPAAITPYHSGIGYVVYGQAGKRTKDVELARFPSLQEGYRLHGRKLDKAGSSATIAFQKKNLDFGVQIEFSLEGCD